MIGPNGQGKQRLYSAGLADITVAQSGKDADMTKVTFIGAGSTVFAKNLMGDIWSYPELADATICLMDIDAKRLKQSEQVARAYHQGAGQQSDSGDDHRSSGGAEGRRLCHLHDSSGRL